MCWLWNRSGKWAFVTCLSAKFATNVLILVSLLHLIMVWSWNINCLRQCHLLMPSIWQQSDISYIWLALALVFFTSTNWVTGGWLNEVRWILTRSWYRIAPWQLRRIRSNLSHNIVWSFTNIGSQVILARPSKISWTRWIQTSLRCANNKSRGSFELLRREFILKVNVRARNESLLWTWTEIC